ncbi:hypothetical protein SCLCIDRAFT_1214796 [Scleroderma citrinum Foug A]|uniref:Uncharacterized protein n=1 Tax=Scleroderma citrinum Foug A TaxID=1036808 RepID=A0A0C3E2I7_9AGAM|nr:hypothetical protein SCLCIDRAFT_1214796 [Scleroderma citrinum Foug A]
MDLQRASSSSIALRIHWQVLVNKSLTFYRWVRQCTVKSPMSHEVTSGKRIHL